MKVKYGLCNVHYAIFDEEAGTYETPVPIKGGVNQSLEQKGETKAFRADNMDYWTTVSNNGYEGDLEVALDFHISIAVGFELVPMAVLPDFDGVSIQRLSFCVQKADLEFLLGCGELDKLLCRYCGLDCDGIVGTPVASSIL